MESDFYDDATIASTPESDSRAPLTQLRNVPADVLPDVSSAQSQTRPTDAAKTRAGRTGVGQRVGRTQAQPARPPISQPTVEDAVDSEEEEEEVESVHRATGHDRAVNTPMIRKSGLRGSREPETRSGLRHELEVGNPPDLRSLSPEAERGNAHVARAQPLTTQTTSETAPLRLIGARAQGQPARQPLVGRAQPQPQDSRKTLNLDKSSRGLFAQAAESRRVPRLGEQFFAEQHSQEAAIQRQIQEAEDREAREREIAIRQQVWRRRWAWFFSLFSLDHLRVHLRDQPPPRPSHGGNDQEDEQEQVEEVTNWLRLLNPLFYLRALVYTFDRIMDLVVDAIDSVSPSHLRGMIPRPGKGFRWILLGLVALFTGMGLWSILSGLSLPSTSYRPSAPGISLPGVPSLPSFGGVMDKIWSILPSRPWSSGHDYDSLFETDDDDPKSGELLKQFKQQFEMVRKTQKVHQDSLDQIQKAMPKLVHMEIQKGKPIIPQDLWHAIREQVYADGNILTMEQKDGSYQLSSEGQLQALISRLANDPSFSSKLNISTFDIEHQLDTKLPGFLESWIKNNNDKVSEWLGPAVDKMPSTGSDREFTNQISKLIKERLKGDDLKGIVVTREDFMQHVKSESAAIKKEFRAELDALQPKLKAFIHDAVKMATENTPQGMSKSDVDSLVHGLIRKAFADMNLEAMANGKIQLHWDAELKHQINFFGIGNGATIDAKRSSPIYDPHGKGSITDQDYRKGLRGLVPLPPLAALSPWDDEGECWCAAHVNNARGNFHGASLAVQLSQPIVPQHIVIEHILPGATVDPDARPKEIEIYAALELEMHDRAASFASTHFPENDYWAFNPHEYNDKNKDEPAKFFKIGHLVYKDAELHDGVHVHRLSNELAGLGATDHIIIRALSNYGAEGHTCFYRVRVFGEPS